MYINFIPHLIKNTASFDIKNLLNSNFSCAFGMGRDSLRYFQGELNIMDYDDDTDEEKAIGILRFTAFNLSAYGFNFMDKHISIEDNYSLYMLMDAASGDSEYYFDVFEKGYEKIQKNANAIQLNEDLFMSDGDKYLICLDRLYINDDYRKKGIGSFICSNLFKLIYTYFNIQSTYVVGLLNPDKGESKDMKSIQKRTLEKSGYTVFKNDKDTVFCHCIYDSKFLHSLYIK